MKKSTIFLLAAVVVLAVVTFLVTRKGDQPPTPKLGIRGQWQRYDINDNDADLFSIGLTYRF